MAVDLEKGMPASLDAERSVLGAVLLDPLILGQAAAILNFDDFSLDSHRRIFKAMDEMLDRGTAIDLMTLSEALARKKELESVGGVTYLSTLTEGLPRRDNIEAYAKIVRDKAMLRSIIHMSNAAIAESFENSIDVSEVLENVQGKLIDIVYHGKRGSSVSVREAAREAYDELSEIRNLDPSDQCIGVPTGLTGLDELTTGFRESEFYVVGARPGQGKTAWMCQSVKAAVERGRKPGVFSIEVPRTQIITRLACQSANIAVFDTRDTRCMTGPQWSNLGEAIAQVSSWDFFMEDNPRMTVKQLQTIARLWVSKGCDCIYVDYLQKLRAPGKNDFERVTAIADGLWELGRSLGVPVIALSQLKRVEQDRAPTMEDLRSSGEIEQNANGVFLIWRPVERDDEERAHFTGDDQFIIAKQRSGPANCHVRVFFDGQIGFFRPRKTQGGY